MKTRKISKILGVGLSLAMLFSLLGVATPASASVLSFGGESSVEDLKDSVDNILAPDVQVISLAVNGATMYAATTEDIFYKSTNGGATWSEQSTKTEVAGDTNKDVRLVAVSPSDPKVVAIVDDTAEVYFTDDGGSVWYDLNVPTSGTMEVDSIAAIDVSEGPPYYVAIGGTNDNTGEADLWTRKLSMAADWDNETDESGNVTADQDTMMAVRFSPNFQTDETITVISWGSSDNTSYFQVFRYTTGSQAWNGSIAGREMEEYGDGIEIIDEVEGLGAAGIALIPTYLGSEETERIAFVAVAGGSDGGGVFRLSDSALAALDTWSDEDADPCGSVAYNDDKEILLGGVYGDNKVLAWANPMSGSSPNAERPNTIKQPSGEDTTLVAWSGDTAVAATQGDESAFAVSTDDGYAWNDISLINTDFDSLNDIAVNADGTKIYMTSNYGQYASVWLYTTAWKRVLSRTAGDEDKAAFLVRIAPENDKVVYVSSKGTKDIWVSKDSGEITWKLNLVGKLTLIQDFVVQSADVLYAIDEDGASKSINAGASWSDKEDLDGLDAFMITLAPNGDVLVGGSDGYISFSKDAGATFTRILDRTG